MGGRPPKASTTSCFVYLQISSIEDPFTISVNIDPAAIAAAHPKVLKLAAAM